MLTSLHIENFAIVATLELDFAENMTAFTGETGAGKSIMIDALMLALGERADASVVRLGAEKCDISAQFQMDATSEPAQWLIDHDINCDDTTPTIFLRRVISKDGRSKAYINGQPFPLQKVKELSQMLVHIHGQHQHQTLLQHASHREQLDRYADHHLLLDEVNRVFRQCQQLKQALQVSLNPASAMEKASLLQYQLDELSDLAPADGEMQALHEEHLGLHHACDYLENTQHIANLLNADDTPNISRQLHQIMQHLAALPQTNPHIINVQELIRSALIQCDEALDEINKFSSSIQLDPERLQAVEERMSRLHQAARKYHVEANQLPAFMQSLQADIQRINDTEKQQHRLQEEVNHCLLIYKKAAMALRESRLEHAQKLTDDITATIRQLGMPKGLVTLKITELETMHAHGLDRVEYQVCTNPGMPIDTLAKVASGGELSRISLAIQMITAQRASTPTLLFDEVDVGIGGATAALVGQLLRKLGERLQVFCVTHQPQVASNAHHHFVVEKHTENEQTFSHVTALNALEKIDEIARMLGGLTITEQTRSHAKELLSEVI